MSLKQTLTAIAFSLSFHGATMSMQDNTIRISGEELQAQALRIMAFAQEADHNKEHMVLVGTWLSQQRNIIKNQSAWNDLMIHLLTQVTFCGCNCIKSETTEEVVALVHQMGNNLLPGQNCSEALANNALQAVERIKNEFAERERLYQTTLAITAWTKAVKTEFGR